LAIIMNSKRLSFQYVEKQTPHANQNEICQQSARSLSEHGPLLFYLSRSTVSRYVLPKS
jgi:hypothetical protein